MRVGRWLRVLVRVDFVLAVALTVVSPLVLLVQAARNRSPNQMRALIKYWRASSLLMVTVYLLIGQRRVAFVSGIAARLLIAATLWRADGLDGVRFQQWRWATIGYCLIGVALNLPMLRALRGPTPLSRAYVEPAQEFGALLHPGVSQQRLGRIGDVGLLLFLAGAMLLVVRRMRGRGCDG